MIDGTSAAPARPGRSGGSRPGRADLEDPVAVAERTEAATRALEAIGAAVESQRPGEAFFALDGLRGIHGGDRAGVLAAARAALRPVYGPEGPPIGVAATRTAAYAAARRGEGVVPAAATRRFLAGLRVAVLDHRLDAPPPERAALVLALERLGLVTLGRLARLSADQVADRFGPLGLAARRLARGEEEPLRPRTPQEELVAHLELPEGTAGQQLERALELLVDRLLAAPQRRGRTLLGLRLGAVLAGGGSWSVEQGLGRPSAAPRTLCRVLAPRLEALPGPASALRLRALGLGPAAADQLELEVGGEEPRRRRLGAAVREVRATQGPEALLRILPVDAGSRVPERWALLTPFPEL